MTIVPVINPYPEYLSRQAKGNQYDTKVNVLISSKNRVVFGRFGYWRIFCFCLKSCQMFSVHVTNYDYCLPNYIT